ncbi:MAG: DUF5996 family protein [Thermoleophilia bacterium]
MAATKETLHRYCQIVGKTRMALTPRRNHWWHVTLRVATRGLTTGPMPYDGGDVEILLDLVDHRAVVLTSGGEVRELPLRDGLAVADFHDALMAALADLGVRPRILARPYDIGGPPFPDDREHAAYDAAAVERYAAVLRSSAVAFERFAGRFVGKTSPVQLFWHSLDLAVTRFSGARVDPPDGVDAVTAEAYSHEVISFGFWAGDDNIPDAAFYSYTAPAPDGLTDRPLEPAAASWSTGAGGSLALLMYEDARAAGDVEAAVLAFFESAYRGGAELAGWDVEDLAAR